MSLKSMIAKNNPLHKTRVQDLDDPIQSAIRDLNVLIEERKASREDAQQAMLDINVHVEAAAEKLQRRMEAIRVEAKNRIDTLSDTLQDDSEQIRAADNRIETLEKLVK